ncbi:hypothetical protein AJ87_02825 [Rhizobium yanglingense]|nr:hypothetical protein AJ87_02825 [Rhizobium yanglingense]
MIDTFEPMMHPLTFPVIRRQRWDAMIKDIALPTTAKTTKNINLLFRSGRGVERWIEQWLRWRRRFQWWNRVQRH